MSRHDLLRRSPLLFMVASSHASDCASDPAPARGHAVRSQDRRLAVRGLLGLACLTGLVAALAWWPA